MFSMTGSSTQLARKRFRKYLFNKYHIDITFHKGSEISDINEDLLIKLLNLMNF